MLALVSPGAVSSRAGIGDFDLALDIAGFGKRLLLFIFFHILVFSHIHHSFPLFSFRKFEPIHTSHWLAADNCDPGTHNKWFCRF